MRYKKNILVIDNNDHHYQILCNTLVGNNGNSPFQLTRANNIEKGKQLLNNRHFDLVLTEGESLGAPKDWFIQIKKYSKGALVVVLTSQSDEKKAIASMKMGIDDYLIKNRETLEELPRSLLKLINKKRKKKQDATQLKTGRFNLLARNIKTIAELINSSSKNLKSGKGKDAKNMLMRELGSLKGMLKNWIP